MALENSNTPQTTNATPQPNINSFAKNYNQYQQSPSVPCQNGFPQAPYLIQQPTLYPYLAGQQMALPQSNISYLAAPPFVPPPAARVNSQDYIEETDRLKLFRESRPFKLYGKEFNNSARIAYCLTTMCVLCRLKSLRIARHSKRSANNKHNSRFNLNPLLCDNILQSDYYRTLSPFPEFNEIIDLIVAKVVHLEPTALGHTLLPSTAFCLLYKLFVLRLSKHQVTHMLRHSNCYVRGIGFLYLRFLLQPCDMWGWFKDYLDDEKEFVPGGEGKTRVQMGHFVENIIINQKFYSTIFPRIPVPIMRDIKKKILLKERVESEKPPGDECLEKLKRLKVGAKIKAEYHGDCKWYNARIRSIDESAKSCRVVFDGYSDEEEVPIAKIKPLESLSREQNSRRKSSRRKSRSRSRSPKEQTAPRRRHGKRSKRHHSRSREKDRKRRNGGREKDLDRELEEFIKWKDKEDASAVGRNYANRPVSYKSCLSVPMQIMTTRQRSLTPPTRPSRRASPIRRAKAKEKKPKKEPSRAHLRKLEELKRIYGDASAKRTTG